MMVKTTQRGSLLIAAVVLIAVIAVLASTLSFLFVGSSTSSSDHLSAAKALFVAEAGLERAAYQYENGTPCNALGATNIAVGEGTFSITATQYTAQNNLYFASGTTSTATTILMTTITGFAPHGRVRIGSEEINYSGTGSGLGQCSVATTCLTGVKRARDGTTAAAYGPSLPVRQHQCLIRSTGTVLNTQRVVERALQKHSEFFDGSSVNLAAGAVNLNGTPGTLPPGHNHVIAVVSLNNTSANSTPVTIAAGNMVLLKNNTTTLASNQYDILVGGGTTPTDDIFNQKTFFFVYRDPNALADAAYNVRVTANAARGTGEVKMLTFNGIVNSISATGGSVGPINAGSFGSLLSSAVGLSTVENVVLAAVQLQNTNSGNQDAYVAAGDLQLCRGTVASCTAPSASLLDSNAWRIDVRALGNNPNRPNNTISVLLMARDTSATNQQYTVVLRPSDRSLRGQARLLVLSGVTSRYATDTTATLGTGTPFTTMASLSTDLLDGTNLVIDTAQFENTSTAGNAGQIDIAAGNEQITYATAAVSSNEYPRNLCAASGGGGGGNAAEQCNDFFSGLLWSSSTAAAASYRVEATASTPGLVRAAAKIMAIQAPRGIVDWQEIFP